MFKCQMVLSEITDIDPLALFKELSHLRFLTYVRTIFILKGSVSEEIERVYLVIQESF
jgi:hypothetical protein